MRRFRRGFRRGVGVLLVATAAAWPLLSWAITPTDHSKEGSHAAELRPGEALVPAHAAEGAGHDEHGGAPEAINWFSFGTKTPPYAAMVLNLGLLIGLYYYFGKKPIAQGLENRRQGVVREIEEAQRLKHEAEQRAKSYQAKLSHLQEELVVTRHALIETGKGEKERIVREAEEKAARMQREVEFLVEQELKQIRQDLWREAVELAVASAEGVLTKGITQADHERLADEYLKDLAKQPSPASPSAGGVS